jgi:WD40 repeat protein/serine/threonine protein kinase
MPPVALDDPRVIAAVEEFMAAAEAGQKPNRREFVARHPEVAEALEECLDGLDFVQGVASELSQSAAGAGDQPSAGEFQSAMALGDFRIIREIGRGGMGVVYEAEQLSLGRRVALKVLPFAGALDARQLQRFKNEAQAAAHLHHTNIVPVHAVGCERGVHYYAMQFIEGRTLAEVIRELRQQAGLQADEGVARRGAESPEPTVSPSAAALRPLRLCAQPSSSTTPPVAQLSTQHSGLSTQHFRQVASWGIQAAEALEYAHDQGIIHRDIKPANLLVDAKGNLWITDFGLARVQSDANLTMTGDLLGTLRYMSPEQALGKRGTVDERTDIYSLGVTLYELLTLEPAFPGNDRRQLLRQITEEEPRPPRRVNPTIPKELETIILKAIGKTPESRYTTAQGLAEDLRHWLAGEPIKARRSNAWERLVKWVKRKPAVAALLLVTGVASLALVGAGVALFSFQIAQEQRKRAEAERDKATFHEYFHYITRVHAGWREGNMVQVEGLLEACPPDRRSWEWYYLRRLCHKDLLTLKGHTSWGMTVAYSPDGKLLASSGTDQTVKLWDTATGKVIREWRGHEDAVNDVAFSPDGSRLASASYDRTVMVWDVRTGQEQLKLEGHKRRVLSVKFSPDGTRLATGSADRTVKVWDAVNGQEALILPDDHPLAVFGVAFSPDGKWLASASEDGTIKIRDATTGRAIRTLPHTGGAYRVAFSPDGTRLANTGEDGKVKVWDVANGVLTQTLQGMTGGSSLAFSPDGTRLAAGSADQSVKVWDLAAGPEASLTLRGHTSAVFSVAFHPDGTRLASTSADQTVKIWGLTREPDVQTLRGHARAVRSVVFDARGQRLASASEDGTVKLWDTATGQARLTLPGHPDAFWSVAFNPDGSQLASGDYGRSGSVRIWNLATGQEARRFDHPGGARSVAFPPTDGNRLASGGEDGTVRLWDLTTGAVLLTLPGHSGAVRSLAFSPNGRRLASRGEDRTIYVWDVATGRPLLRFQGGDRFVGDVAFSPEGNHLAIGDGPRVKVWDATTGQVILSLISHSNVVRQVVFSPDGARLASASLDGTVKVWDAVSGQEAFTLRGHVGRVLSVVFSPDGHQLATAGGDGTVKVWDARPLVPEAGVEREALSLLDCLFAKPLCKADVIDYLRNAPAIRPPARQLALSLVDRYHEDTDPENYHQASAALVRQPYLNVFQYRFALKQAEAACRLAPDRVEYRATLSLAKDRLIAKEKEEAHAKPPSRQD